MIDLVGLVQRHLDLLDQVFRLSKVILSHALSGDIDRVSFEIENRERMIKLIGYFQTQIENHLNSQEFKRDSFHLEIIKPWFQDLQTSIQKINQLDEKTSFYLEALKKEATKEIASTHENSEKLKGYNLTDLKNR